NDVLVGDNAANVLSALGGNDYLQGRNGADLLQGGDGSDRLEGGAGADQLQGGAGSDFAAYYYASVGVTADLLSAGANTADAAGDSYLAIEGLIGSSHADTLNGDNAANHLLGLNGNDTLRGRGGADSVDGGAGSDSLEGGADNDVFRFAAGQANGDLVLDFQGNGALTGDMLIFHGYGAGATFVQASATVWNINYGGGSESITFANAAAIQTSDYAFI
ncbi:MAG TPA: calcium-binding protein, partial [Burkholderiales bacterium]|nr:calcium-binding protein [Burkholderiales bacterium]